MTVPRANERSEAVRYEFWDGRPDTTPKGTEYLCECDHEAGEITVAGPRCAACPEFLGRWVRDA